MEMHKNQKQAEALVKRMMQEIPQEKLSENFTQNLLQELAVVKGKRLQYKPLISWKTWVLVAAAMIALVFMPNQKSEAGILSKISVDFSFQSLLEKWPVWEGLTFSNTTLYAVLLFALMIGFQVFYLKGYFNRRLEH